ncbi:uncharacterized protein BT62DRAFT_921191 [Guyanagaster necrorhizus]|uniref:Uncharacterized protein n=1 Tax=Guyanagaster necrorhizus TaxID=856835 RepID=A0A9P7VP98_9AGAR|nr:uncharacterized protein BT62DRAFT_921191 [Guyanagaster necrorhizus MCA 3950]KAG7444369.1 hypothetical protein BT62DRAFT_921191 [Guyanagaster necrorhizus MCA 3950]
MNPGRIILACWSEERGQAALEGPRNDTGYQKAELWLVDLSRFSSVTAFANKFEADGGHLDIHVLNAGIAPDKIYRPTSDGWESSLQINNIASSLLASSTYFFVTPFRLVHQSQSSSMPSGFRESELRRGVKDTWYMALAEWTMVELIGSSTEEGSRQPFGLPLEVERMRSV